MIKQPQIVVMPSFYFGAKCYVNWLRLMWNTKNKYSIDIGNQECNPRKNVFLVSLCITQNVVKSSTSSFSVEPMFTASLKDSSTSGNTPGVMESLRY